METLIAYLKNKETFGKSKYYLVKLNQVKAKFVECS